MKISVEGSIITVKKDKVYIDGRVTDRLLPIFINGKVHGVINPESGNILSSNGACYRTQLLSSIRLTKGTSKVSKINESKKFIPVYRERKGGEVEVNLS